MTQTIPRVDVDVDLTLAVPCLADLGTHDCPAPATRRIIWTCPCVETYCTRHHDDLVALDSNPDGITFCSLHHRITHIARTEKL